MQAKNERRTETFDSPRSDGDTTHHIFPYYRQNLDSISIPGINVSKYIFLSMFGEYM